MCWPRQMRPPQTGWGSVLREGREIVTATLMFPACSGRVRWVALTVARRLPPQETEGGERDGHSTSNVPSMLWKGEVGGIDSCQAPPSPGTPHAVLRVSTSYNTFLSQKPVPPLGEQPLYSHRKRSTLQRHPFTLFERTATLIMLEQEHSSAAVLHPSSSPAVLLPATRKQCPQPFELTCRAPPSHSQAVPSAI